MQHVWIPSTYGHGETMCRNCGVTNREAAVLGDVICFPPVGPPENDIPVHGRLTVEEAQWMTPEQIAERMTSVFKK